MTNNKGTTSFETLHDLVNNPFPPPLIHLHHPHHPSSSVLTLLASSAVKPGPSGSCSSALRNGPESYALVHVDAIECHTPRILFSAIITRLRDALGLDETIEEIGEVNTVDRLVRRLQHLWSSGARDEDAMESRRDRAVNGKSKSKGKRRSENGELATSDGHGKPGDKQAVMLLITKAERLGKIMGQSWSVVTRLAELVSDLQARRDLDQTVITKWASVGGILTADLLAISCSASFRGTL
jgi:origin recognition complex subunit 5